jgi:hypothetical protein
MSSYDAPLWRDWSLRLTTAEHASFRCWQGRNMNHSEGSIHVCTNNVRRRLPKDRSNVQVLIINKRLLGVTFQNQRRLFSPSRYCGGKGIITIKWEQTEPFQFTKICMTAKLTIALAGSKINVSLSPRTSAYPELVSVKSHVCPLSSFISYL